MVGRVIAVSSNPFHGFSKFNQSSIKLIAGLGVEGDAHAGKKVKHRSRVAKNPHQPNLRQVHLILHSELHQELQSKGFNIKTGQMEENITTQNIDLLDLPRDTRLKIGEAIIQVTGLRNPCSQLDDFKAGLMAAVLDKHTEGNLIRKAGIMGIVVATGEVFIGDDIEIELPPLPHKKLDRV